jgi:hypothetical protein
MSEHETEDKPPRKSEIRIHYRQADTIVSANEAPTKIEADNMSLETLEAALEPDVFPYIKRIEIVFADE